MSEKTIQHYVVGKAKARGWQARKRSTLGPFGSNGEPDYEFSRLIHIGSKFKGAHLGYSFHIEFKAPGKTSTPLQKERQQELRDVGFEVYECDNKERGLEILEMEERELERRGWLP